MTTTAPATARRTELILRQVENLPTLPAIATRLLSLTADTETHARQVIELVSSDPTLTAKVLSLCRKADKGVRGDVLTIERAVVLLGYNAIRNAVLSLKVFELFDPSQGPSVEPTSGAAPPQFDRVAFWWHSLAVAIAAELIAESQRRRDLPPDEAFVCGLLHDVGKIALDEVLPKAYCRIVELTNLNQANIAEFERRIVGLDHHTVGKRLAEQWGLPHRLQDTIWLHGSPIETLPQVEHRRLIGVVSLADLIVRQHHIGYSGNFQLRQTPAELAEQLGIDPTLVQSITMRLHEELERRGEALGLGETPSRDLFLQSIQQANQELGRLNSALERRSRTTARLSEALAAVRRFHEQNAPGQTVQEVLEAIVESAQHLLGEGYWATVYECEAGRRWSFARHGGEGRISRSLEIEPPAHAIELVHLDPMQPVSVNPMGILPWISDCLADTEDLTELKVLPLGCGWGTLAVLIHDRPTTPPWEELVAVTSTWGAALASARQHEGARRLGEELAATNRQLAETQEELLQTQSLARLGEMAAGAAHEMNNPLAVISGRSQLLTMTLPPGSELHRASQVIYEQAHRLSDLITALHVIADPPRPNRQRLDLCDLLTDTVQRLRSELPKRLNQVPISMQYRHSELPTVLLDPDHLRQILTDLLLNALQAAPKSCVHLSARVDSRVQQLVVQVSDDGVGMDRHTLEHAFDPFFSAKEAGRRMGMGLTRAQQLAKAHGGRIELRSTPGVGTTASLTLSLDSADD